MAALSQFHPHLFSLSSHTQFHSANSSLLSHFSSHSNPTHSNGRHSILCCASTRKPRASRKLLSDEELFNRLREFVAAVGLPEDHVPSTKELALHGRKDLANIVRRRGHKLIKDLLNSEEATDACSSLQNWDDEMNRSSAFEETGQKEKVNDKIEESASFPTSKDDYTAVTSIVTKSDSAVISDDQLHVPLESPLSLQDKVERFMKYGQLDVVEEERNISDNGEDSVGREALICSEDDIKNSAGVSSNEDCETGLNGTLVLPKPIPPNTMEERSSRDVQLSAQQTSDFNEDTHSEVSKLANEVEINDLKHVLHQKELELSRLKEEIEKEKQALSMLQRKAEDEIYKAQKLISEKDAELSAAEESLSGLVEAKIQYSGEGQVVEVAGSFNGWHQKIELEPQLSSVLGDPVGFRRSRLWSTTLWLYPGVYEIKFIVDGQWKIDPQRETAVRGGIENNIFRVRR